MLGIRSGIIGILFAVARMLRCVWPSDSKARLAATVGNLGLFCSTPPGFCPFSASS